MANAKEIQDRMKSINDTLKITCLLYTSDAADD